MKQRIFNMLLMLGLVVALSACGNANDDNSNASNDVKQENGATEEQAVTQEPAEKQVEFEKGVFIDLEKENNPLLNEQIKQVLKKNLDAQVNLDEEAFRSTFKDSKTADAFMGTFGGEYKFTEIFNISEDKTKDQILVNVTGEMLRENAIEEAAITYYFAADADEKWSIVAID